MLCKNLNQRLGCYIFRLSCFNSFVWFLTVFVLKINHLKMKNRTCLTSWYALIFELVLMFMLYRPLADVVCHLLMCQYLFFTSLVIMGILTQHSLEDFVYFSSKLTRMYHYKFLIIRRHILFQPLKIIKQLRHEVIRNNDWTAIKGL